MFQFQQRPGRSLQEIRYYERATSTLDVMLEYRSLSHCEGEALRYRDRQKQTETYNLTDSSVFDQMTPRKIKRDEREKGRH